MLSPLMLIQPDRTLARSALPAAPHTASAPARREPAAPKRAAAAVLRRAADRLAPEPWPAA
jgi:hypothetical protein